MSELRQNDLRRIFNEMTDRIVQHPAVEKKWPNERTANMFLTYMGDRLIWDRAIGAFWIWDSRGFYVAAMEADDMRRPVMGMMLKLGHKGITTSQVDDIISQIRISATTVDRLEDRWVSFADCLWSPMSGETAEPHPSRVATLHVPMAFTDVKGAAAPMLEKFLKETCLTESEEYDPGMEAQLQEFAGYLLWPRLERVPCLFLYGDGHNGKSVYIDILKGLVGEAKTSSCGLEDLMGDKFGVVSIAGMRFNASDEMGNCREATTEKFKKLIVGDTVRAQRKFGQSFDMKPDCRFCFSTNTVPAFSEVNVAMKRRLLIIPFHRDLSPFRLEDRKKIIYRLGEKIVEEELPGLVRWAMEGLERLHANQFWMTATETSADMMRQFEEASSSVFEWCNHALDADPEAETKADDHYGDYVAWSEEVKRKAVAKNRFCVDLAGRFGKSKVVWRGGKNVRIYRFKRKSEQPKLDPFG